MPDWKQFVRERVPSMLLPPTREAEIFEELATLLEDTYNDALSAGSSHEDALARAAAQLPQGRDLARRIEQAEEPVASRVPGQLRPAQVEDRLCGSGRGVFMSNLIRDFRYALRMLAASPAVTLAAVITLALGIGANTAIFSIAYALLEKPVAIPDPRGIVSVREHPIDDPLRSGAAPANYLDWRAQSRTLNQWAVSEFYDTNLSGIGEPERVQGFLVSSDFFETLRARPLLGRTFLPGEDEAGNERLVILSYGGNAGSVRIQGLSARISVSKGEITR